MQFNTQSLSLLSLFVALSTVFDARNAPKFQHRKFSTFYSLDLQNIFFEGRPSMYLAEAEIQLNKTGVFKNVLS